MEQHTNAIAVVGMSGRFPGGVDIDEFWGNLLNARETTTRFSASDYDAMGISGDILDNEGFVPVRGIISGSEYFDAEFFGYSPREAELIDPQQRVFLECCWNAIENAGYDPLSCTREVGVFAGCNQNTYQLFNIIKDRNSLLNVHTLVINSDKDFLSTRVSYKLGLQGPSASIQSACSTSLVCIHYACNSLLNMECDMALAGGVSIVFPGIGYYYVSGGVMSPDGKCRAFDANAQGTIGSDGVGVVVLKRLEDAIRDKDNIYATVIGSAINNDGGDKASFASPSAKRQAAVIKEAIEMAEISPETIRYIETHGTGTPIGDAVEVAGLKMAFSDLGANANNICKLGSVKCNIGHLDQAAGVTGFIKAVLSLRHGLIPPTINFSNPHPALGLEGSQFTVNDSLTMLDHLQSNRIGVSSFGFGGTNAHIVLDEAPKLPQSKPESIREWFLLPISTKTIKILKQYSINIANHIFSSDDSVYLADIAYVLQTGRSMFANNAFVVANTKDSAYHKLMRLNNHDVLKAHSSTPNVYFVFPGQGAGYLGMGYGLYHSEYVFKQTIDEIDLYLKEYGISVIQMMTGNCEELYSTEYMQPILFAIEFSLAKLYMSYGIVPNGMIGHSLGEYVAACISGVFSLQSAMRLVVARGKLMQNTKRGAMVAVYADLAIVNNVIGEYHSVSIAAYNAANVIVISGGDADIQSVRGKLERLSVSYKVLRVERAFHSSLMASIVDEFRQIVAQELADNNTIKLTIPFVSNVTGEWVTIEQVRSFEYWAQHLMQAVQFARGVGCLAQDTNAILLEVGPGRSMSNLVILGGFSKNRTIHSMRSVNDEAEDMEIFTQSIGYLWSQNVPIDWEAFYARESRCKIPIPGYPFARNKFMLSSILDNNNIQYSAIDDEHIAAESEYTRPDLDIEFVAPESRLEYFLSDIWQHALGISGLGVDDNFFELGGHSISAIEISAQIKNAIPINFSMEDLINNPTIMLSTIHITDRISDFMDSITDDDALNMLHTL